MVEKETPPIIIPDVKVLFLYSDGTSRAFFIAWVINARDEWKKKCFFPASSASVSISHQLHWREADDSHHCNMLTFSPTSSKKCRTLSWERRSENPSSLYELPNPGRLEYERQGSLAEMRAP
jgi:hypothetical protein